MKVHTEIVSFDTKGEIDFRDLTGDIEGIVDRSGIKDGFTLVFAPHATGVIVFTEYERGLLEDIRMTLRTLFPREGRYRHPANAHSHIRSMFLTPSKVIPVLDGRLGLGTWQSVCWIEVDHVPRTRRVIVEVLGE
ncbi:MAG: secondary thiamine-phosphate synthase enzyme YjbQ [Candidatus Bathyarchaeia archaeon]